MKFHQQLIFSSLGLFALTSTAFANHTKMMETSTPSNVYIGVFGGGGSSNQFSADQYGTAYYFESMGGPLAVNGFGHVNNKSGWFFGAQLGYQAQERVFGIIPSWTLTPAAELEGFYLGKKTFSGTVANDTSRLPEHNFDVSYPTKRSVFLTNAVLSLNNPCFMFHPYIGFGIGGAIARISGADSLQVAPQEPGVNHYNSNTSDTDSTFAGQIKLGLSYDFNKCVSIFAEYRWLYLASTHFTFGSTVYPTHAATSSWQVDLGPQRYNLGSVGLRFNI